MEFNNSSSVIGTLIIFAIISFLSYSLKLIRPNKKSNQQALKPPPEAGGSRPIIGHLSLFSGKSPDELPHLKLSSIADQVGPIFTIRLGVKRVLVVSSWDIIKELSTTHDVAVSDRPRFRANQRMSYDFAMSASAPYGAYWRGSRKLMSMNLLASRRLEPMSHLMTSEINESVRDLYKAWSKEHSSSGQQALAVDMKHWFGHLNLNVILKMVVGKRIFDGGPDAKEGEKQRQVIRDWFHYMGMMVPGDAFPFLAWLDIGGHEKKMKEIAKKLDSIMDVWLAEHKKANAGKTKKEEHEQDFMDAMLEELARGTLPLDGYDADVVVKATCLVLIAGGTDTVVVSLEWTLALLLNNPRVLKRLQEEIHSVVGKERRVNVSDISKLSYLQAVAKEASRLYPAGPLGGIRQFSKDVTLLGHGGYHVPKGTWFIMNLWKLQRDPSVWGEDAEDFRPERFLQGDRKDVNVFGQDYELIPFGAGRRICPGSHFSMQMMHLVFANIVQAFDFRTASGESVDMSGSAGMTNRKATPFDVLISPRLSHHLY